MPISPTYPGVYIEELPSGVRTITGVPTSITAFVGVAARGPAGEPVFINSYADYERNFGGLGEDNPMGYSVFQFYQNGGSQAIIVRILGKNPVTASISLETDDAAKPVLLNAKSGGAWGSNLRARVDFDDIDTTVNKDIYNLTVRDTATG